MGLPKSVRLDVEVEAKVEAYLDKNGIRFAELVNLAVDKFISEPQTITLTPVEPKSFLKSAEKAFKKHKGAMDKLK